MDHDEIGRLRALLAHAHAKKEHVAAQVIKQFLARLAGSDQKSIAADRADNKTKSDAA